MNISRKLTEGRGGQLYLVEGNPEIGYTLHSVTLSEVGHFKRSWQAIEAAATGGSDAA